MPRLAVLTALLAGFAAPAYAQEEAGMRQLGAHVHGGAEMIMAADPDGLVVAELSGALWNFYGFEGAAGHDQADAVSAVNARLAEPDLVSISEAAGCALVETALVGAPAISDESGRPAHDDHDHGHDHDEDDGHAEDHARHDEDHDHGDHDHHGHDHGEEGHVHGEASPDNAHGDLVVNWSFQCDRPERIESLDLGGLFAAFDRLEHVEAQYLDAERAAAGRLTPASPALRLN